MPTHPPLARAACLPASNLCFINVLCDVCEFVFNGFGCSSICFLDVLSCPAKQHGKHACTKKKPHVLGIPRWTSCTLVKQPPPQLNLQHLLCMVNFGHSLRIEEHRIRIVIFEHWIGTKHTTFIASEQFAHFVRMKPTIILHCNFPTLNSN